jgi:predicted metal-dependent hydrolase
MLRKRPGKLTVAGCYSISLNGRTVQYVVKRSRRARNIRFEIRQKEGLVVVVPWSYPLKRVPKLIESKQKWILDRTARYEEYRAQRPQREKTDGDIVTYLGNELRLQITRDGTGSIAREGNSLIIMTGATEVPVNEVLRRWYREQAEQYLRERTAELSKLHGIQYNRVTVRGQRTRWGSCSRRGSLSLNWKLMTLPPEVVDYVIIHELLHTLEMNHSKKFWKLVEEHCPAWREHEKRLKKTGITLAEELPF